MAKIEIRNAYGDALKELGGLNQRVVALEADVGSSSKSAVFGKAFPDRYFNVGIAELNMVSMAAGMAAAGLIPFVNTFAVFMMLRGGDPVQSMIAHDKLNVKLAGAYTGFSDSYDGSSHQAITDISQARAMPNLAVLSVCDAVQCRKAVFGMAEFNGPVYTRLSRAATEVIYDESAGFRIGGANKLTGGKDVTIFATGYMVQKSLEAAELLKADGIQATVVDVYSLKPVDTGLVVACARETGAAVTAEEHNIYGGLGSIICEELGKHCPVPVEMVGVEDCFAESGDYEQLLVKYGLSAQNIAAKAKAAIARKK
jgi:transketolase